MSEGRVRGPSGTTLNYEIVSCFLLFLLFSPRWDSRGNAIFLLLSEILLKDPQLSDVFRSKKPALPRLGAARSGDFPNAARRRCLVFPKLDGSYLGPSGPNFANEEPSVLGSPRREDGNELNCRRGNCRGCW